MGSVAVRRCWQCSKLTGEWGPCIHCGSGPTGYPAGPADPLPPPNAGEGVPQPVAYIVHRRPPMDGEHPRLFTADEEGKVRSYEQMGCTVEPLEDLPAHVRAATLVERGFSESDAEKVEAFARNLLNDAKADVALLRDLIDRRPDLNAVALRPGQAVHVHALERILADLAPGGPEYFERMCYHHDRDTLLADVAAMKTFAELCDYGEDEDEPPIKPGELDALILRAREIVGYTLVRRHSGS